jgi:hypothetical protein
MVLFVHAKLTSISNTNRSCIISGVDKGRLENRADLTGERIRLPLKRNIVTATRVVDSQTEYLTKNVDRYHKIEQILYSYRYACLLNAKYHTH